MSEAPRVEIFPCLAAGRVHAIDLGPREAPAALLLHGLGGLAGEVLAPLRAGLLGLGLRVIAVDRPGYGLTAPLPASAMGPASQARWLARVMDELQVRRPLVIGHSFGAAVALCLARDLADRIAGLLLVNPFCRPTRPAAAPWMRLATAPVVGAPVRRGLAPAIAGRLVRWSLVNACAPDPLPGTLSRLPSRLVAQESAVLAMAAELRAFNRDMAATPGERGRIVVRGVALTSPFDRIIEGERHGAWLQSRFGFEQRSVAGGHMLHHTRPDTVLEAARELLAV